MKKIVLLGVLLALVLDEEGLTLWQSLLAASAAVTAAVGLSDQFRWAVERFIGLFLVSARLQDPLASHLASYLEETASRKRKAVPEYGAGFYWVKPLARTARVVAEILGHSDRTHYWVRVPGKLLRRPLWLSPRRDDDDDLLGSTQARYPRGFDFETFLKVAAGWRDEVKSNRHRVVTHYGSVGDSQGGKDGAPNGHHDDNLPEAWRPLNYGTDDVGQPTQSAAEHLALAPESLRIIEDARRWLGMRPWYQERSVAHRRGYLVDGPPGSGKTTIVRETAAQLDLPIHVVDLATHTNQDLQRTWQKIAADVPCAVLLEDVDGVFVGRQPAQPGMRLTFDALLNSLDGVSRRDGVALFMTTNHAEKLDPALVRPGRVDVRVKVGPLDLERRLELARKFLGEDDEEGAALARATGDVVAAEFVERCLHVAQRRQWGDDASPAAAAEATRPPPYAAPEPEPEADDAEFEDLDGDEDEDDGDEA